ncbi:penicillin-binding transpeptidase domain-containing protein [Jiulongibacter sp. NS-SX5]|uniref:penicillin-binding transpeptidase domain-containing protein n=1 Tax=Jiulongibacter sp. NS-SX5 TaxID=3463854 RepID=UPI004057EC39
MKTLLYLFISLCLFSCHNPEEKEEAVEVPIEVESQVLQELLTTKKLKGAVLLYRSSLKTYYSNDFDWATTGFIPASTFKIANSIQALENGVVDSDTSMFYWDGSPRYLKSWEEDLTFQQAFQRSCVPCYQEIARETGVKRMDSTLKRIGYPGMVFDSTSIDNFWLEGNSKISQKEQIEFLKRLVNKELPVVEKTYEIMSKIMLIEEKDNYDLYGKTGWAQPSDSTNIGWFVGFAITPKDTFYMATNVQPAEDFDMSNFGSVRMGVSLEGLESISK